MARNSYGQHVNTLSIVIKTETDGLARDWDWESIIRRGANLTDREQITVLDVNVEE